MNFQKNLKIIHEYLEKQEVAKEVLLINLTYLLEDHF